jgi:hypothetical protein
MRLFALTPRQFYIMLRCRLLNFGSGHPRDYPFFLVHRSTCIMNVREIPFRMCPPDGRANRTAQLLIPSALVLPS